MVDLHFLFEVKDDHQILVVELKHTYTLTVQKAYSRAKYSVTNSTFSTQLYIVSSLVEVSC